MARASRYRQAIARFLVLALGVGSVGTAFANEETYAPLQWSQLSIQQQRVLLPAASEWETLSARQQNVFAAVAKKYDQLTPQQQARLNARLKIWASMSSEERAEARRAYLKHKVIGTHAPKIPSIPSSNSE